MQTYALSHLSDPALSRDLAVVASRHRGIGAELLAHLAEFDARKLYLPAAHPSMFAYCVAELRFSEDEACRRIQAARTAREFPVIFDMVADGRLNLSAVLRLSTLLNAENAAELLAAAAGRSRAEIEHVMAEKFPSTEPLPLVQPMTTAQDRGSELSAPARISRNDLETFTQARNLAPIAFQRYEHRVCLGQSAQDDFEYAKALLGHAVPSGDSEQIYARAFAALVRELERSKLGASRRSRATRAHASNNPRYIPARVKLAVWERDHARCTFVSVDGNRCNAREQLEFDHIDPVARGGGSNADNIRLRCRAHNQYEAERMFGADFMRSRREAARDEAQAKKPAVELQATPAVQGDEPRDDGERAAELARKNAAAEVVPYLRGLGFGVKHASALAEAASSSIPDAPLEVRVKAALKAHGRARLGLAG